MTIDHYSGSILWWKCKYIMRPLCPRGGNRRENLWPFQRLCVQTPKTRQCQHHCNPSLWSRHLLIIVIGIITITRNLEFSFFNLWLNLLCWSEVKCVCRRNSQNGYGNQKKKRAKLNSCSAINGFVDKSFLWQRVRLERGQLTVHNLTFFWKRLTKIVLFSIYLL